MKTYNINKQFDRHSQLTENCIAVMRMFGLTKQRLYRLRFECDCRLDVNNGDIVYITGPSGTGKSVLLNELKKQIPANRCIDISKIRLPKNKPVIDCISDSLTESLKYLSIAGLADCPSLLNLPVNLSVGQRFRLKLAIALSKNKPLVFIDEFCSILDRITAMSIAANIRKFADKHRVTFILASAHQDFLRDLLPDVIVTRDFSNNTNITYKTQIY